MILWYLQVPFQLLKCDGLDKVTLNILSDIIGNTIINVVTILTTTITNIVKIILLSHSVVSYHDKNCGTTIK